MPWIVLLASAVFEAGWAVALGYSDTLTRPVPTIVFVLALAVSMVGLGWAARHIPIGTAYAVWTGVGAALTVVYTMATGDEPARPLRILFLCGIVGATFGLKFLSAGETREEAPVKGAP